MELAYVEPLRKTCWDDRTYSSDILYFRGQPVKLCPILKYSEV